MIKYIIVLLISATFYVLPLEINAQNKSNLPIKQILKVSPIILDIQLKKGHNKYEINIDNLLNAPLGIGANAQTFDPLEDVNDQAIKIQNPLVDWTNIENPNTLINLGQSKTITIDIDVPQNAKDGGYSEVIFLTPIFIGANNPKSPTVLSRIGVLVLANLGKTNYSNLSKKTSIENFKFTNLFYEKLPAKLTFEVKNNYFNHFSAKPFLTLYPLFGKPEVFYLEEKHVLPGQKRIWSEIVNPKTKSIYYNAKLAVSVGQGYQIFKGSYFFVFPIRAVLSIFAVLIFAFFIVFRRKQIKKAILVLIKGK